jgi:hypothetical protein
MKATNAFLKTFARDEVMMVRSFALFSALCVALLLSLSACQGEKKEDVSSEVPETSAGETSAGDTTEAANNAETTAPAEKETATTAPAEDSADGESDDCVAKCVQRNQMKAVGADQIERDCEAECKQ